MNSRVSGGPRWPRHASGLPASAVRQDRIIDEIIAVAGDLRRICDLFGVTINTAQHCTSVLGHPALAGWAGSPAAGFSGPGGDSPGP